MKKYGIENFFIETIEECNVNDAEDKEKYWIEYYGSFKNGYNATLGGDGKSYIDRELVIKTYKKIQNQTKVARICGISLDSVSNILEESHIKPLPSSEVNRNISSHPVAMLDINTKQIIKTFFSQSDAARWLIQENKTVIKDSTKVSYIVGRVVRGLRKSAYGYVWIGL